MLLREKIINFVNDLYEIEIKLAYSKRIVLFPDINTRS